MCVCIHGNMKPTRIQVALAHSVQNQGICADEREKVTSVRKEKKRYTLHRICSGWQSVLETEE